MPGTLDELASEALLLPDDQRITLAHRILLSTEPAKDTAIDALWETEIVRRIELADTGRTGRHPASQVFEELDHRLG